MDHQSIKSPINHLVKYSNIYSFINLSIFINFKPCEQFPGHFPCQNIDLAQKVINN